MIPPNTIKVIPEPGRKARKPDGTDLAAEGELVPNETYWWRRFDDGDVTIEMPKPSAKPAETEKKA